MRWYVDGREDDPRPPGNPKKGITEREEIIDAELAEVEYVTLSPEEFRVMQADGRWAAIQASAPQPGTRAWQHFRARLAGRAQNVNTAAQAKLWAVSEQTILDWRKTWGNSSTSRDPVRFLCAHCPDWVGRDLPEQAAHVRDVHGVTPKKTWGNSLMGREVDSMPLTKADMNELREELEERYQALHADVRASLGILLERFPGNAAVEAAVDEFLDDTLGD